MTANEMKEKIIAKEWLMFQETENAGGRASCQDNYPAFEGMRMGQFDAWSDDVLTAYLEDVTLAESEGRNLIAEKYLRMMEETHPAEYEMQKDLLPPTSVSQYKVAAEICEIILRQSAVMMQKYPIVAAAGRPLHKGEVGKLGTSIETYQMGELMTYSEKTLTALLARVRALESEGVSYSEKILENSVKFYGYTSLDQAEEAQRRARG